jgi:PAS domain S-box-containing protein
MKNNNVIAGLREDAARAKNAYEWEEVRDLITKALDNSDLPSEIEYELRMDRAESYRFMANLYGERADLEVAIHLANKMENPRLEIEALVRHSAVLMLTDGPSVGLKVAENALALAGKIAAPKLESDSLYNITAALYLLDDIDAAAHYYEQWSLLVQELDYPAGQSQTLLAKANLISRQQGDEQDAREAAHQALDIYRRSGDLPGQIEAYIRLGIITSDLGRVREYYEHGLEIASQIRYRLRELTLFNNLAFLYYRLGLYNEALTLAQRAVELGYRAANHRGQVIYLATLAECYMGLDDYEAARKEVATSQSLARRQSMPQLMDPYPNLLFGLADFFEGKLAEARAYLSQSADRYDELSNPGFRATALAWLGAAALAEDDLESALNHTAESVAHTKTAPIYSIQELWWWRYQALKKRSEIDKQPPTDEVWQALDRSQEFMLDGIKNLSDEGLRRNYLNKVPVNRDIVVEWSKRSEERNLGPSPLQDRDGSAVNLQEPFRRLVEIGSRLTAHRDPELLPGYILNQFVELSGAERAFLALDRDLGNGHLEWSISTGISSDDLPNVKSVAATVVDEAVQTRQPGLHESLGMESKSGLAALRLRSAIVLPLISQGTIQGIIYGDMRHVFGKFEKRDLDLLSLLANQAAAALENADYSYNLEQQVEQRTSELSAANAELSVINSVQQGLASKLEFQAIIDLVGDTLNGIFGTGDLGIALYDRQSNILSIPYFLEHGDRFEIEPSLLGTGFVAHIVESKQPLLVTDDMEKRMEELGSQAIGDLDAPLNEQYLGVPIMSGDEVIGVIGLGTSSRERIFDDSMVSLVSTLASSMSVALENARLFEEAKVLLDETEQRNAELTIINSAVSALAKQLDYQAIIDLVGERIREVFGADTAYIIQYDKTTNLLSAPYFVERGFRHTPAEVELGDSDSGLVARIVESRQPLNIGTLEESTRLGAAVMPSPGGQADLNESYLGVPILVGDEVTGAVGVQSYKKHAFDESDVRLLNTIATNTGVALENARLFDETARLLAETEQRNSELAVINSVQQGLAAELDMQAIYDLIGDQIRDIFDAQVVDISSYDHENQLVVPIYEHEKGKRYYTDPSPFNALHSHLILNRETIVINENAMEVGAKYGLRLSPGTEAPKSMVFVPLMVAGVVKGYVSLQNIDRENAFSDSDVRLLSTLANSMSVALENARLFDETTRLLGETEQRNSELAVINSVQQGLAAELDVQAIYDLVGDQIQVIFDAQAVMINTYDHKNNLNVPRFMIEKGKRFYGQAIPKSSFHDYLIENRQLIVVNEDVDGFNEKHGLATVLDSEPSKSMLFMPMVVGNIVKGFVSLQNIDRENAFSSADLRLLTTLVNSMSVALENARLFDETTRLLAETEQQNSELAVINSVQQGLAAELDMKAIYDLVGNQIREMFDAQVVLITSFDHDAEMNTVDYAIEKGERLYTEPSPLNDFNHYLIRTKQTVLINDNAEEQGAQYGLQLVPGTEEPKSMLFVPLIVGETVKGAISLQNIDHENAFSDSDVRLLTTLSSSMSVALENARLFDETNRLLAETERRVNELSTVNRISQALASELELEGLLELVGEQTRKTFRADIAYVALHDQQSNMVNFAYQFGDNMAPIKYGDGLTGRVLESGEPLLINEGIEALYDELDTIRIGAKALSYLGVPIKAGRQPIGVISVQSTSKEGRFDEDDVRLLNTIAAYVGAAIQNARLYQESQRSAEEMATLAEIGSDIAATRELEPVLERMTSRVMELLKVGDIALYLPEPDGINYRAEIVLGKFVEEIKASPIQLGGGIIGDILQKGTAEFVNHPYQDPRARHIEGTPPPDEDLEALMAAPLHARGEVIGGIAMWRSHKDGLFTDNELDFLVSVARQAAIAIESARLYMETQKRAEEMSALAAVGRDISATLEPGAVLERIASHARELLAADTSAVYLPDPGDQTLQAIVAIGEIADEIKADVIQSGEGIIGDLYSRGAAEVINDTAVDPRGRQIPGTADIPEERLMIAPLLSGERVNGMMAVWRSGPGELFTNEHLRFLRGLAQQAAIAIENARLFTEIRRQKQYFEALVQSSPAAILTIDMEGKGETWNPAAERLFGYSEIEAVGQSVDSLVASADSIHSEALEFNQLVSAGESVRAITQRTRKDGKLVDVELFTQPVVVDEEQVGMIAIYHDITEIFQARRQAEEARQEAEFAREDAERANAAKSTFLANMSHELRTPLNAIIGFTRIVKRKAKDALPQKQIDNLDKVLISAEHLLGLINTILDISKIEAGRMDVQSSTFNANNLIGVCATTAQPLVKTGVRLEVDVNDDLPPVYSDQDKLKQVLLNLLSNAAKFTHEGTITVTACRRDDMLEIDVSDTGIGISTDDLGRVFEEFQQADSGTTRQYGGTGLGLPISRQLARLLGGDLVATSKAGEGSTFTITIPLHYGEEMQPVEKVKELEAVAGVIDELKPISAVDHPLILAIDDDPDVVYLLQEDLGDAGYEVIGSMSGEEGMKKALELKPLAITLDIMMPQKDGWQVLHELKTHPDTRAIPVIMLSIVDKKALGYQLGAADYLVKPLDSQEVLEALRRLTVVNGGTKLGHLLVVDDDPNVIDMARQLLENEPIEVDSAGDGVEAMAKITKNKPDAILLDLMMPKMDGFAVIEKLNQNADLRDIPVIVLTAKILTAAELDILQDSAAQIIMKQGLKAEELVNEVQKALSP